jgi:LPXTG-motif cell wall-anchored protein
MADLPARPEITRVDDADWPQQVAGMIVDGVGVVRDKTTVRVETAARWVVFGLLAALLGMIIGSLLLIVGIRALTELLQWATGEQDIVWLTYAILGAAFVAGAFVCFRRARR